MMRNRFILIGGLLLLIFLIGGLVLAEPDALSLSWWTIDGGGGTATGGNLTLTGTIGQADAGNGSGGDYTLYGGFWSPVTDRFIYLPTVMNGG